MQALRALAVAATILAAFGRRAGAEAVERRIDVDGVPRTYRIHVPATWDRVRPLPVLFVFHGAGGDPESMRPTGFEDLAAGTNMLVVYPAAIGPGRRYDVEPAPGRNSADVRFVDALLARLRERFPVDDARIWATGFSNGAAFCYRLAVERFGVIAAIAPVAGYLPGLPEARLAGPVPTLHVHGAADDVVGSSGAPSFAEATVATWAARNGARTRRAPVALTGTGGLVVRKTAFEGATGRSDTQLLLVEGVGHAWPGAPGGPVTRAILDFFLAHPRPAPATRPENPLVGKPFGSTAALRWSAPVSVSGQPLTLFRWWTNRCPHCTASLPVLAGVAERWRARGLEIVAVYHPKGAPLSDARAGEVARGLGFSGTLAFDDRWTKLDEMRRAGGLGEATSISILVDREGIIRWVHPGPRIEAGSADLLDLEATLERLLPPTAPRDATPR